jgi:chemotaxis protein histidine kinase CheA
MPARYLNSCATISLITSTWDRWIPPMPADAVNAELQRVELESARVERDLLQAVLLLDSVRTGRFRSRALALADSVPPMLRLHTREQEAFRVKLERLGEAMRDLSQLLRELPGTVRIGSLDDALSRLAMLQQMPHATGDELLPVIPLIDTALSSLRRVCQSLPAPVPAQAVVSATAVAKASSASLASTADTLPTALKLERALQQRSARLSREHHKELRLDTLGLDLVPADWYATLYDVCAELLANAAEHGIETAAGRTAAGKDRIGQLQLHITRRSGGLELSMRDDGRGLDVPGIFRAAVATGHWPEHETTHDPRDAARLIFKPGVTTAIEKDGRGGGMRRVLTQLKSLGARIRVSSERGSHLRLCADLPPPASGVDLRRQARA